MAGRVMVSGASGFVGSAVVEELLARGYSVNALVNEHDLKTSGGSVRCVRGGLFNARALDEAIAGCDAVIHLVGIIMVKRSKGVTFERIHFEGTKNVVDAAVRNGVRRYVHMSALGVRADAVSTYHRTKYLAEQYVRASGLDWTIFRPSLIHGPRGEFMRMEAMWARMKAPPPVLFMPFMPYFGGKRAGKLQPVYVGDVARAFVDALEKPKTIRQVYPIAGPDEFTWPELHRAVAQAVVGQPRRVASMPVAVAKVLAAIGIGRLLGFNRDQVIMSQEDNTTDLIKFKEDFGWDPKHFTPTLNEYAGQLRS